MNTLTTHRMMKAMSLIATLASLALSSSAVAGGGKHASSAILPPGSRLQGKTYSEWSAEWWRWAVSIPAAENPLLDATGEYAQKGQGDVWFLAGAFGGTIVRNASMPAGKSLFFPVLNSLWWAPEDLEFGAFVAETYYGLDPDDLTDEELIGVIANFQLGPDVEVSLEIDGVPVENPLDYLVTSPGFRIHDRNFLDDLFDLGFAGPISKKNQAVTAGYWFMLAPLPPGEHMIRFTAEVTNNPLVPDFELDITYNLTVGSKKK